MRATIQVSTSIYLSLSFTWGWTTSKVVFAGSPWGDSIPPGETVGWWTLTGEAHAALWAEASERLRDRYGEERFERWFAPLKLLSTDGAEVVLAVANEFMRDFIESHYSARITEALELGGGRPLTLAFEVDPELFSEVRREERRIFSSGPPSPPPPPRARRRHGEAPTLESFVVGVCNRLGFNAALQVLECPGRHYNPLFVHGPTGVGKTHLLQGLASAFRDGGGDMVKRFGRLVDDGAPRVKYLTSEEFTNQFVMSLQNGTLGRFRERFRSLDVLLVDDVQLLVSKKKTQEEFLHTFNALVDSARQVVLGCDVPPKGLPDLSRAMVTRFMSGLVVGLKRPDLATRVGILEQHARKLSGKLDIKVLETVAGTMRGSARELIGALKRLDIHARVDGRPLGVEQARDILAEFLHEKTRQVHPPRILRVVASHYGLTGEALMSKSRQRTVVLARHVAMYLVRRYTGKSLAQVGVLFGKRSHATAKAAEWKVAALLETDAHFVQELDDIVEALEGASAEPEPA